jgi:hypothetical protein
MREKILVVTSNEISGYQEVEHLGLFKAAQ